jgi:peptidoglycan/LPS O-acetylase OafA/YrhL
MKWEKETRGFGMLGKRFDGPRFNPRASLTERYMGLQRVTTTGRWIPEIDGLRFIAIIAVLFVHIFDQMVTHTSDQTALFESHRELMLRMNGLGRGVQVFFVISGLILARPFVREYVDGGKPVLLRAFYKRRLTRIEPPYMVSLIIYAAALMVFRGAKWNAVAPALLSNLFYVHTFFYKLLNINFPTYSLEIEVQFYLIAPLLAMMYAFRPTLLRRGILVLLIAVTALLPHHATDHLGFLLPGQICYFLLGNLLADLRIIEVVHLRHWLWDVVSLLCWPALFIFRLPAWGLCLMLFIGFCSALLGPVSRRAIGTRWIALIGGMCYSVYLMHMILISSLFGLVNRLCRSDSFMVNYAIQVALLVPVILAFSFLYYVLIERPCMDPEWPSKLWTKLTGRRAAIADSPKKRTRGPTIPDAH